LTAPSGTALARIVGIQTVIQFAVDFTASLIVARLLSPTQIGSFSIAMAAVVIAQTLRTAGVNMFLIATPDLDTQKVRSALGISMIASFGFAAVIWIAAPYIAAFYREAVVSDVLRLVSVGYLFAPYQVIAHGLLTRALRLVPLMVAIVAGVIAGGATSVSLAFMGWGSMSLAAGALMTAIVQLAVMIAVKPPQFVWRPSLIGGRSIWGFTGWVLGSAMLSQIGPRLNELFVGRALGIASAALLDRAEMLPRMVWSYAAPPVLNILSPLVAHEIRTGVDPRDFLLLRMRLFGCIFSPILVGMATQSGPILIGLYGWQWHASIAPAPWLCISAAMIGQFVVLNASLSGLGETRALFFLNLTEQAARFVMLCALSWTRIDLVAAGTIGVALVYAAAAARLGRRLGLFSIGNLIRSLVPTVTISGVIALGGIAINLARGPVASGHEVAAVLEAMVMLAILWVCAAFVFQREVIVALWKLVKR
jgi:O-antigen/teichoic acid export membrane protein